MLSGPYRVIVVGAGGIAAPIVIGLVESWPSNIPLTVTILDYDIIELSNLNRQILFTENDIGISKAECLASRAREVSSLHSSQNLEFSAIQAKLTAENIRQIFADVNFVFDATDSIRTKFLINDYCVAQRIPFSYAGVIADRGQFMLIDSSGKNCTCLRCLFGSFTEHDFTESQESCRMSGVIGPVAGFIGLLQLEDTITFLLEGKKVNSTLTRFSVNRFVSSTDEIAASKDCPLGCYLSRPKGVIDLTNENCPRTFLTAKLAAESLSISDILDFRFSEKLIAERVAQSLEEEGYSVICRPLPIYKNNWRLLVAKCSPKMR